ncbi:MAG: hypothetical protein ACRECH_03835 [Nitrososphaerales archaeon]
MEAEKEDCFVLTERDESDILLFCEIAKVNGAVLSLDELMHLTSINVTEEELSHAWRGSDALGSKYILEAGFVLEKDHTKGITLASKREEEERKERAIRNIGYSRRFAALCSSPLVRTLSISGSTSYFSVSESDDLDFFTVTSQDAVWIFLAKSLLLSRLKRIVSPKDPEICFSYTVDAPLADLAFSSPRSGLFARDALTVLPILGSSYYQSLLARSFWMREFFPKLYRSRLLGSKHLETRTEKRLPVFLRVANIFLYYTIGTYIRLKSWILNRRFAKWGKYDRIFRLNIGTNRCIYESRSYLDLRRMYSKIRSRAV